MKEIVADNKGSRISAYLSPFQEFIKNQATASILLLLCTIIALLWASIPSISASYEAFVNLTIGGKIGSYAIYKPLYFWVNDVLLTIFFFYVGLEIKRSFLVGELQNHQHATFVIWSAFGGMLVPAIVYSLFNFNEDSQHGWAIPMATDTAFVIGILTYFKDKLPKGIFAFIASLAIIDDIGAVAIIAIFYTSSIDTTYLFLAVLNIFFLGLANYAGVRSFLVYLFLGVSVWIFMEASGIQGAISGIIIAFIIPSTPGLNSQKYVDDMKSKLNYFQQRKIKKPMILEDNKQHSILEEIQKTTQKKMTPLQHWETKLKYPNSLFVLPLFALVNAGVPIDYLLIDDVFKELLSLGIVLGLFLGKPIGVILFGFLSVRLKLGVLPRGTNYKQIIGASMLTGIGFTMSLFITNLSFSNENQLILAKTAIFIGSLLSALIGFVYLYKISTRSSKIIE